MNGQIVKSYKKGKNSSRQSKGGSSSSVVDVKTKIEKLIEILTELKENFTDKSSILSYVNFNFKEQNTLINFKNWLNINISELIITNIPDNRVISPDENINETDHKIKKILISWRIRARERVLTKKVNYILSILNSINNKNNKVNVLDEDKNKQVDDGEIKTTITDQLTIVMTKVINETIDKIYIQFPHNGGSKSQKGGMEPFSIFVLVMVIGIPLAGFIYPFYKIGLIQDVSKDIVGNIHYIWLYHTTNKKINHIIDEVKKSHNNNVKKVFNNIISNITSKQIIQNIIDDDDVKKDFFSAPLFSTSGNNGQGMLNIYGNARKEMINFCNLKNSLQKNYINKENFKFPNVQTKTTNNLIINITNEILLKQEEMLNELKTNENKNETTGEPVNELEKSYDVVLNLFSEILHIVKSVNYSFFKERKHIYMSMLVRLYDALFTFDVAMIDLNAAIKLIDEKILEKYKESFPKDMVIENPSAFPSQELINTIKSGNKSELTTEEQLEIINKDPQNSQFVGTNKEHTPFTASELCQQYNQQYNIIIAEISKDLFSKYKIMINPQIYTPNFPSSENLRKLPKKYLTGITEDNIYEKYINESTFRDIFETMEPIKGGSKRNKGIKKNKAEKTKKESKESKESKVKKRPTSGISKKDESQIKKKNKKKL